jgi:hypothetical protein
MNEMPKMTAKYQSALTTAHLHNRNMGLMSEQRIIITDDQETLYAKLNQAGYFWNSAAKTWDYHELEAADEPTALIMVRVWSDSEIIDEAADEIINGVKKVWKLVERSTPYQCRPPKQQESRVYLKFLPKGSSEK